MTSVTAFVIVGVGLVEPKAVETLRNNGFYGDAFTKKQHLPYERPRLSKNSI
ncbi:hypothetical protein [Mycobacterium uberis]|uniref:hypothetical protein n=1 Tax=Mycobacterium uberis TaxID=2162698 RepID=UPI001FB4FDFF|nr:hypothetical protein [Mycobacterium uberis]